MSIGDVSHFFPSLTAPSGIVILHGQKYYHHQHLIVIVKSIMSIANKSHPRFMESQNWNALDRLPSFGFPSFLLLCLQLLKQRNSLLLNLLHGWLLAAQTQCAKRLHPARN
jgi:hypothetical protein